MFDDYFRGRVAVVTGGGSGMGRATAQAFAQAGARTVVADVADAGGHETVAKIQADGGVATYVHADVSKDADVRGLIAETVAHFGRLDCAVNNAAIEAESGPITDCEESVFDLIVAVNLKGVFLCMKHEIRQMLIDGGGAIVNIASVNAFRPQPEQPVYTATKHAVLGITRATALDYAPLGIRVNAVCPGAIRTPMLEGAMQRRGRDPADVAARLSLLGRLGEPTEIARAVLWLCSDQSSFTIGHPLAVDGGYLSR
jgi:NAD(P)-dependent dehydrogenase (short-subunit alcohol dehydrogenase family)